MELFSIRIQRTFQLVSYNTADAEANQEMVDILRRRKKVKRKRGVGF